MTDRKASKVKSMTAGETAEMDAHRLREYALIVADLTHELRTPLGSIVGGASVLDQYDEKLDDAAKSRICSGIIEQTRRLDTLFTALAALARVRTGTLLREQQRVELNELLRGLWAVDPNTGGSTGVVSLLREEVFLDTDPMVVRIMLSAMLGLTAIFIPDSAGVDLSLGLDGNNAVITISCNSREDERARLEKLLASNNPEALSQPSIRADAICLAAIREVIHSLEGQFDLQHDTSGGRLCLTVRLKTGNVSPGLDKT